MVSPEVPSAEDVNVPAHSRILRYDEYFDLRTFSTTLRKTAKPAKQLSSKKPVLVVRRIINEKGQYNSTEVDIKSTRLCQLLLEINGDVEGLSLTLHNPIILSRELFHCRPRLLERLHGENSKSEPDTALISEISIALQFIEEDYAGTIGDFNLLAYNEVSYDLLWVIFPPNTMAYRFHTFTEQHQILLARTFEYSRRENGTFCASIHCDVINNDGISFGFARERIEIDAFRGARRIQDLIMYPLAYHPEKEEISARAVKRAKKFVTLPKHSYNEINGPAMREKINDEWQTRQFKFSTHGRVMIDPVAFRLFEPNCTFNLEVHRRLDPESLTDEQYMICTPIVLGFCFGVKMWGGFALDRLQDIIWSDEAFRSLVLGAKKKNLIYSLFKSYSMHTATFDDVVRGKGKGLIGLFSGRPGCGKTLTAEAVAEVTRRPLYSVSAGELGTQPKELDERLTLVLEIAQTWDAVLLLDEAEVFLQQRSKGDVTRNALVSIFLRQLEYYQGILILTTNMIEQCDPAFESRIHLSLHYPDLGFESRRQVWETFIAKTLKNTATNISSEHLDRFAGLFLNGRQIKNIVSSAQCVALDANTALSVEHIDAVLEVVDEWNTAKELENPL
ncbi:P-loop containing nucleoside triphosphate hydrolase protein [Mycena albidolilacea]|uniref:P-loop containing nucleoside triphosphate hydrolase protein n=1 Tax=Mycena albidolilacea TaxID=1033008 RepID=A0AAD7A5J1_9AGAR|nr:P-loop containing nucleoside triphosphate hydrolase protein [Mycena albidolilacea]